MMGTQALVGGAVRAATAEIDQDRLTLSQFADRLGTLHADLSVQVTGLRDVNEKLHGAVPTPEQRNGRAEPAPPQSQLALLSLMIGNLERSMLDLSEQVRAVQRAL